jgi:hypothetical protein
MATVKPHTRRTKHGTVKVRQHSRKVRLQPKRARKNAGRAWRAARRKRRGQAVIYATAAAAEIGTWTVLKGGSAVLVGLGIALAAVGYAAKRRT